MTATATKPRLFAARRLAIESIVAVVWCLVTLATDRLFFRYTGLSAALVVYKLFFVGLAFLLIHGLVSLAGKLRAGDAFAGCWLRCTLPYLAVSLVVLALVWPGCWGSDDLTILAAARTLEPVAWQHFLTSGAFILSLMFLPLPGGIVLIQDLLISAAVGCFAAAARTLVRRRVARPVPAGWFVLVYLPFLLPPVLLHNQQPFRTTWSAWCELFTVFLAVWWSLDRRPVSGKKLAAFTVLGILTAAWRSESIYYLAALPVLLAVLAFQKRIRPAAALVSAVCVVAGALACNAYNNALLQEPWLYQRVALCYQTAALVQDADPVADAEALAQVDHVFDVQACRDNPTLHGAALRSVVCRDVTNLTVEDWNICKKGIIRLALKYPGSLLRERLGIFKDTIWQNADGSNQKLIFASTVLVYDGTPETMSDEQRDFLENSLAVQPLNRTLREDFIMALSYDTAFLGGLPAATWWMLPPLVLLGAAVLVLLLCRRWMLFLAAGALFARVPLVFLTAPDTYFMYYLSPYMAGWAVTAAALLWLVVRRYQKTQERGIRS